MKRNGTRRLTVAVENMLNGWKATEVICVLVVEDAKTVGWVMTHEKHLAGWLSTGRSIGKTWMRKKSDYLCTFSPRLDNEYKLKAKKRAIRSLHCRTLTRIEAPLVRVGKREGGRLNRTLKIVASGKALLKNPFTVRRVGRVVSINYEAQRQKPICFHSHLNAIASCAPCLCASHTAEIVLSWLVRVRAMHQQNNSSEGERNIRQKYKKIDIQFESSE